MSTTKRVTVNFPAELYRSAMAAIDGVHYLSVTQVVLVAVDNLVRQGSSSPLPSGPLLLLPPLYTYPLKGIYIPPLQGVQTPRRKYP
jgi:hypothetical protein